MFTLVTSALNVELVYIILKGITQFSYINDCAGELPENKRKKIKIVNPDAEDVTIILKEIKIKNVDQWSALNRTQSEHS